MLNSNVSNKTTNEQQMQNKSSNLVFCSNKPLQSECEIRYNKGSLSIAVTNFDIQRMSASQFIGNLTQVLPLFDSS
jgi:hypothetical protein